MPIIDERGRLFGKINLIDLALLLFVVVLMPLAYGAYVLFRTPPPRATSVTPNPIVFARGVAQRVRITGEHLRPFLRARLGATDVQGFTVETTDSAELRFADIVPGTYDLVLFDESQEVSRLPHALTILPSPIQIVGEFDAPAGFRDRLASGSKFGPASHPIAELVDSTTIRATCTVSADKTCLLGGTPVRPGVTLRLPAASSSDPVAFHVKQLRVDAPWTRVHVRLMGVPESIALVRAGDIAEGSDPSGQWDVRDLVGRAQIESTGELRKNQGSYAVTASVPQPPATNITAYGVLSAAVPVDALDADLVVPLEPSNEGPRYRGAPIRPGVVMTFETHSYALQALIMTVEKR